MTEEAGRSSNPVSLVVAALRKRWGDLLGVWAFGSRIQGNARPDSDWDLAILIPGMADPWELWSASGELADILGSPVDLIDLRRASTVMQYLVVTTGERWWQKDAQADLYEAVILSEKATLDAARAPLLRDIWREGHIYNR